MAERGQVLGTESGESDEADVAACSAKNLKPREYQLDIVRRALKDNVIACLPTGSGKTFVAILLMKELGHEIEGRFEDGAKRTVFVVPSVALVTQQHREIVAHTRFSVGNYVGSDGVDNWSKEKWQEEFSRYQVLVMTAQIMVNILVSGYMENAYHKGLGCVNLLVMDECHHAAKGHPYVQVLERMSTDIAADDRPRVLGLSASLVNQSDKSLAKFEERIDKLKGKLMADVTTARDMAEVTRYATKPNIELITYCSFEPSDKIMATLNTLCDFLCEHPLAEVFKDKPLGHPNKDIIIIKGLKNSLVTLKLIYVELGSWAASKAARTMARDLRRVCSAEKDPCGLYRLCLSRLKLITTMTKQKSYSVCPQQLILRSKLRKLKDILVCHAARMHSLDKHLQGIVFVDRRYMALALNAVLNQMSRVDPSFGGLVKSNFLTGHGDIDIMSREAAMKVKTQNKIIAQFAEQKINILIATRVAEEGLDIRKCNLVVRFDPLQEFRGYVQSRGRARDKPSSFIVMAPEEDKAKMEARLNRFAMYEQHLIKCCQEEHHEFFQDWEDEDEASDDDEELEYSSQISRICPPFYPNPAKPELARADMTTAIQIVNMYVSKLCSDGTQLAPTVQYIESASESFPQRMCYECVLMLPACSALPNLKITGAAMPTRRLAKRAACLEVVRLLYKRKELNEHLRPVLADDYLDEEEFEGDELELVDDGRGKKNLKLKALALYPVKVPHCFQAAKRSTVPRRRDSASSRYHLYTFQVSPDNVELRRKYTSLYGIVLPDQQAKHMESTKFPLWHPSGQIDVTIRREQDAVMLTPEKEVFVSEFTRFVFADGIRVPSEKSSLYPHLDFLSLGQGAQPGDSPVWYAGLVMFTMGQDGCCHVDWPTMQYVCDYSENFRSPWSPAVVDGLIMVASGRVIEKAWESCSGYGGRDMEERGRLEVLGLCSGESANTSCGRMTFAELDAKRGYPPLKHPELPLMEVCRTDFRWDFIGSKVGVQSSTTVRPARVPRLVSKKVMAEHCKLHVLTSQQMHSASLLPSLLIRLFHQQQAKELHSALCSSMAVQAQDQLRRDASFLVSEAAEESVMHTSNSSSSSNRRNSSGICYGSMTGGKQLNGMTKVFPGVSHVFESLSRTACRYQVNLERLEMLGDSFLKLATSVYLYCHPKMITASEGSLSDFRRRMISNATLYKCCRLRGLAPYIFKPCIHVKQGFIPPLCRVNDLPGDGDEQPGTNTIHLNPLKVKHLADTVEALIGAFLLCGGNDAARHFMVWCGIPHRRMKDKKSSAKEPMPMAVTPPAAPPTDEATSTAVSLAAITPSHSTTSPRRAAAPKVVLAADFASGRQRAAADAADHDSTSVPGRVCRLASPTARGMLVSPTATAPGANKPFFMDTTLAAACLPPPSTLDKYKKINALFLQPTLPKSPGDQFNSVRNDTDTPLLKDINAFLPALDELQQLLQYEFRDLSWLLEAITHPSYDQHDSCVFVRSYQQLEFLGDAILDYLVVRHIYDSCSSDLGPGDLALILHSVTCNAKLAEIAVDKKLQKYLRHGSPALFRAINAFVEDYLKRTGADGEDMDAGVERNFLHMSADGDQQGLEWLDIDQDSDDDEDSTAGQSQGDDDNSAGGSTSEVSDDTETAAPEVAVPKALGDLIESLTAAVFVDCNMDLDKTWNVLYPIMKPAIDDAVQKARDGTLKSPIMLLYERFGLGVSFTPEYTGRRVRMTCTVELKTGPSVSFCVVAEGKYTAKIACARKAMEHFRQVANAETASGMEDGRSEE